MLMKKYKMPEEDLFVPSLELLEEPGKYPRPKEQVLPRSLREKIFQEFPNVRVVSVKRNTFTRKP